jgi:hypothetical protein
MGIVLEVAQPNPHSLNSEALHMMDTDLELEILPYFEKAVLGVRYAFDHQ